MRLIRSIATVSFYTIISRIFGFLRTSMMANFLGAGAVTDALVIAIKVPSVMRRVFAEGAFNAAFVPLFAGILAKEGPERARTYAECIFSLLVMILSVLTLVVIYFMPDIMPYVVSGFSKTPERMAMTIEFTRITFPFILFISICALYSGILNSLEKFAAAAASPVFGNMTIIGLAYILIQTNSDKGTSFAYAIAISGLVQALVVMIPAWKEGMRLRFRWPAHNADMKKFFILLGPAVLGSGVVQVNIFLDMLIGSYLPTGSISYLEYADRLNQLPLSVIGAAMGTALLPLLSKQIRVNNHEEAHKTQNLAIEYAMTLAVPSMMALFFLAYPIVKTVFQFGKLTPQDTEQISYTLMAFALGTPAYILVKIFSTVFFANHNTKAPVYVAIAAVGVNLTLNLLLYKTYAHVGLAFATALASWFNAGALMVMLISKKHLVFNERFKQFIPKLALSCTMAMAAIYTLKEYLWPLFDTDKINQIVGLTILTLAVLLVYGLFCFITGIYKLSDFKKARAQA